MRLCDLKPNPGSKKNRKRVGRGPASGHGKTCGRGHKGQGARSGAKTPVWSEGGQMPLQRRVPKRGFRSLNPKAFQVVNLGELSLKAQTGDSVDPESLKKMGLIRRLGEPVKVLANGDLDKAIHVRAHAFSRTAQQKIEQAGGRTEIIEQE